MLIRKLALAGAFVSAALPKSANAADWIVLADIGAGTLFVDQESIRTMPDGRKRAWSLIQFVDPGPEGMTAARMYMEYDCREGRTLLLQLTSMSGEKILSTESPPARWSYAAPETVGEKALNYICFGKKPS